MSGPRSTSPLPVPRFRAVLLDWRGTLVVAPTYPWLVSTGLGALGRDTSEAAVTRVLDRLRNVDRGRVESSVIDTDPELHRSAYLAWFRAAGLDADLAASLYAVECDVASAVFADDVGPTLQVLADAGIRLAVVSDIHVDLRPAFAGHTTPDGRRLVDLVDAWVLSYELGMAKPDHRVFETALARLGATAAEAVMVGDRGPWDGAAAEVGITTLVLPPLRSADHTRLHSVIDLVLPGQRLPDAAPHPAEHRRSTVP